MAIPDEFTIHIEPDGKIVIEGLELHETSYRRILELLEETIGPIQITDGPPDSPTGIPLRPTTLNEETDEHRLRLGQ